MGYHRDDLVARACIFAVRNHLGQTRKGKDKSPVMEHVSEVANLVKESGGNDLEIASAYLHDTVEDTSISIEDIINTFGPAIGEIVDGLTDPPDFYDMHTFDRKSRQAERIRSKSNSVKLIKVADQISNVQTVAVDPPVEWNHAKCLDYVEGAWLIVQECRGASEILYQKFQEAYRLAKKAHQ